MLVLNRKQNQQILIDGEIKVTIIKVHGNKVRIGIDAPEEVSVHRSEVADRIRASSPATLQPLRRTPDAGSRLTNLSSSRSKTSDSREVRHQEPRPQGSCHRRACRGCPGVDVHLP